MANDDDDDDIMIALAPSIIEAPNRASASSPKLAAMLEWAASPIEP